MNETPPSAEFSDDFSLPCDQCGQDLEKHDPHCIVYTEHHYPTPELEETSSKGRGSERWFCPDCWNEKTAIQIEPHTEPDYKL